MARNIIQGRTNVTIAAHHVAVDDHVYYSDKPVDEIVLNAYYRKGGKTATGVKDFSGKSVIIIRGYAYNGRIKALREPINNITLIEATSHEDAVRRLEKGHADYLLDYKHPVSSAFQSTGINANSFAVNEISRYAVYYVVSKKTPNAKALAEKLSAGLGARFIPNIGVKNTH